MDCGDGLRVRRWQNSRMPNVASVLKEEISRLARKEVVRETQGLRSAISTYRTQIAALRRKNEALERQVRRLARSVRGAEAVAGKAEAAPRYRFSAKGLATHRQRLGFSAADYGALVGASALSVYKWEKGEVRPRDKHLSALAAVRRLGKREASAQLAARTE